MSETRIVCRIERRSACFILQYHEKTDIIKLRVMRLDFAKHNVSWESTLGTIVIEEQKDMKGFIKAIVECAAVCIGLWFINHRRVFAACLTGDPMPEAPEWHKKCFGKHA